MAMTNTRLRVLAERAVRTFEDHRGEHPALEDFSAILPKAAAAFIEAYDAEKNFEPTRVRHMSNGQQRVKALHKLIRTWSGTLSVLIPTFKANELKGNAKQPDLLLADAKRLLEWLEPERARLPRADELIATLTQARSEALEEWTAAQRTLARHRELQHALSDEAELMNTVLNAFRSTLEEILGVDHRDCQMLRTPKSRRKEPQEAPATTTDLDPKKEPLAAE